MIPKSLGFSPKSSEVGPSNELKVLNFNYTIIICDV